VNAFDLVVVVLVVIAVVIGFRSGALPQLIGLAGAILGGGLALALLPRLEVPLASIDSPQIRAFVVLAAILFSVGIGEAIGSAIGRTAASMLGQGLFGALDRVLGGVVGGAQALLVIWLTGGLLAAGPSATLASQARTSFFVRALDGYLPAPTEMAAELSQMLDVTGLPDLFVGLEPIPAPPVTLPDNPLVKGLAAAAEDSTVKVTAGTCLSISSGTGFVVARGYVVTNAHVVAGAGTVRVSRRGDVHDAAPVFFDPDLDIALLYVPSLRAPPLEFAPADPARGAVGATFGFPGGLGLDVQPAAVTGAYPAQGRDIYGSGRVTRRILELRAQIDQGDSGGPLVLADGTVGGVVFAEARTDPDVGYALTPTSVHEAIAPALGRTGLVPVGACIH
jgi:S1-C subfamily serine protease